MIIKIGDRLYGDDSGDYVDSDDGDFDHSKEYAWEYLSLMGFSPFCLSECLKILKLNIATEHKDISSKMTSFWKNC